MARIDALVAAVILGSAVFLIPLADQFLTALLRKPAQSRTAGPRTPGSWLSRVGASPGCAPRR